MNAVSNNPNASVAAGVGAAVTVAVWVASALGLDVPPEVAAAVTTLAGSIVLLVGNRKKPGV